MKDGFITVAAATPEVVVADCVANTHNIIEQVRALEAQHAKLMVFPELCITGYTCSDLFWQDKLLDAAQDALVTLAHETAAVDALIVVGLPLRAKGKLMNVAAALNRGRVLGFVPKQNLPAYNEFYEARHFCAGSVCDGVGASANRSTGVDACDGAGGSPCDGTVTVDGAEVPVGTNLLFACSSMPNFVVALELCEDLWVPRPPSINHALAGATVIANLSASDEMIGKNSYRRALVSGQSGRLVCAYLYATAGLGESTTDLVFGGQNMIAENGTVLAQSELFANEAALTQIDVDRLAAERRRMSTYPAADSTGYVVIPFDVAREETTLTRVIEADPFVPKDPALLAHRCEEILTIQAQGLRKRLEHTQAKTAVVGISGGLDSTLALLVMARSFDLLGKDCRDIIAVTMPGFGTTDRTYTNACSMVRKVGATLKEVSIAAAVEQHFSDIGLDISNHDVTYENAQARERTQILMDIANQTNGLVVGTGDLSELALGWATYNGDHMSMYGVNSSVPKTLVRHLVRHVADTCGNEALSKVLIDVLETPVSPELLPPEDGVISQKTEDLVGPYELHDFFLYHMLRLMYAPSKIYRLACRAFDGRYDAATILKWLKTFYRRFFTQQFKRSCLPDGPKVGSVAVSPRGDLRMPSDAQARIWLDDVEQISLD